MASLFPYWLWQKQWLVRQSNFFFFTNCLKTLKWNSNIQNHLSKQTVLNVHNIIRLVSCLPNDGRLDYKMMILWISGTGNGTYSYKTRCTKSPNSSRQAPVYQRGDFQNWSPKGHWDLWRSKLDVTSKNEFSHRQNSYFPVL